MSGFGSHHSLTFRFNAVDDGIPSAIATGQQLTLDGAEIIRTIGADANREVDLTLISSEAIWTGEAGGQDNHCGTILVHMEGLYASNSEVTGVPGGAFIIHNHPFQRHTKSEMQQPLGRVHLSAVTRFKITTLPVQGLTADGLIDNLIGVNLVFSYV